MGITEDVDSYVQLAKIGDVLWRVSKEDIYQVTIVEVERLPHFVYRDSKGYSYFNRNLKKSCFKTLKEAQAELQRRHNISLKRSMLKNYEEELNKTFDLDNHHIIH